MTAACTNSSNKNTLWNCYVSENLKTFKKGIVKIYEDQNICLSVCNIQADWVNEKFNQLWFITDINNTYRDVHVDDMYTYDHLAAIEGQMSNHAAGIVLTAQLHCEVTGCWAADALGLHCSFGVYDGNISF